MLKISNECWHTLSEGYDAKVFVQCYKKEQKFDLAALKSLSLVFKYGKYKDVFYLLIVPWGEAIPAVRTQVTVRAIIANDWFISR